jgi:thiamine-phosphate pyrophosphorylase
LNKLKAENIQIPIYAIGGITFENIDSLISTGIHGVAISGMITKSPQKEKLIQQLNKKLYANVIV